MRVKDVLLALSAVSVIGTVQAAAAPAPFSAARIDALVSRQRSSGPGCVAGILQDGKVAYRGSFGFADVENRTPFSNDSAFNIGSTSKHFTSLAVLLLVEDGKLRLDDDIRRYIPELPDYGQPVTVRELLTQTAGVKDSNQLMYLWGRRYIADRIDQREAIAAIARQRTLNFKPGSEFLYSNSNFQLAAEIVARVSGMSFGDFMKARIFGPLGMAHTEVADGFHTPLPGRVQGYMDARTRIQWPNFTVGDGNIFTNLDDLAKWDENFRSPKVGAASDLELMSHPQRLPDGTMSPYAMGLYRTQYRGQTVIEHDGSTAGFVADFMRLPGLQSAIAVLCNDHGSQDPDELARKVADAAFFGGAEARKPTPSAPGQPLDHPEALAGSYWSDEAHAMRRFALADGRLVRATTDGDTIPLQAVGSNAVGEGRRTYVFLPGGRMREEAPLGPQPTSSRASWDFRREAPADLSPAELDSIAGDYCSDEVDARWSFASSGGKLVLRRHGRLDETLIPLFRDAFREDDADLVFDHPEGHAATSFTAANPRLGSVTFRRCTY